MKSKIFSVVVAVLFFTATSTAQQNQHKIKYFGAVQTGMLVGSSDVGFTAQTLQGIQVKNWIAAAGLGFDGYGVTGVPLVFHGQRNFTKLKHQPFVYGQTGIQFPVKTNDWNQKMPDGNDVYDLKNGFIAEAGAGYQWQVSKRLKLVLTTGFSYKHNQVIERQFLWWVDFVPGPNNPNYTTNTLDYYYRRLTCKFGIEF